MLRSRVRRRRKRRRGTRRRKSEVLSLFSSLSFELQWWGGSGKMKKNSTYQVSRMMVSRIITGVYGSGVYYFCVCLLVQCFLVIYLPIYLSVDRSTLCHVYIIGGAYPFVFPSRYPVAFFVMFFYPRVFKIGNVCFQSFDDCVRCYTVVVT